MTTTQRTPIGHPATAPTAAQRVVTAMWTLGKPATAKAIAQAAGVGYSTVTPILRNLLTDHQAVKTDNATGHTEWQLTAALPSPPPTDPDSRIGRGDDTNQPDVTAPDNASTSGDPADADHDDEPTADTRSDTDDTDDGHDGHDGHDDGQPECDGRSAPDSSDHTSPQASATTGQATARTYRKPVQPRRPKGHLRAAVLAVLDAAPEQAFKVSEVCKAINAANTDGSANKAGAGAVANALDKLVNSGDATRVEDATVAAYRSAATGG